MVDIASVVIAVISLIGSVMAGLFPGWLKFHYETKSSRAKAKELLEKYNDQLFHVAYHLQSELYTILDPSQAGKGGLPSAYTYFLIGQYFSWTHIFRCEGMLESASVDKADKGLDGKLREIRFAFSTKHGDKELWSMLSPCQQLAIEEAMSTKGKDGKHQCMSFLDFEERWKKDEFDGRFNSIKEVFKKATESKFRDEASDRLRHLQHLLLELVFALDNKEVVKELKPKPCGPAPRSDSEKSHAVTSVVMQDSQV